MIRFKPLPNWCLTGSKPAFYDTESATAVEQTAKLYGVIQELINDYNKFTEEINTSITEFIESTNQDQECFKKHIDKIVHDYIAMLDDKVKLQDKKLNEAIEYMTTNIQSAVRTLMDEMIASGEIDEVVMNAVDNIGDRVSTIENKIKQLENVEYTFTYNEESENLVFSKLVKEGE